MKKFRLSIILACCAIIATVAFQSCVKDIIKDAFPGFNFNADPVDFTIPVVNTTQTGFLILDTTSAGINLDQAIKDNVGSSFSLDNTDRINISSLKLKLNNADNANNWANFSSIRVLLWSNTNTTPVQVGEVTNIPDVFSSELEVTTNSSLQMKDYLSGQTIYYMISGIKRRNTTRELPGTANTSFRLE